MRDLRRLADYVSPDDPGALLRVLEAARKHVRLYLPGHPQVRQALMDFHRALTALLEARSPLRFDVYEDAFFLDNRLLLDESLHVQDLLADLAAGGAGSLEFSRGAGLEETSRFIELLATVEDDTDLTQAAGGERFPFIRVGPPRVLRGEERADLQVDPTEVYRIGLRTMAALNHEAAEGAPLNMRSARLLVTSMLDVILRDRYALLGTVALRQHDEDTCHHSVGVAVLSLLMGYRMGMEQQGLAALGTAALLHDVGKMRIPRAILTKPGRLSAEERALIDRHPIFGAELLRNLGGPAQSAMLVALEHHLGYDLSGYPRLTFPQRPHLLTRVIAIADYFDAVTSARRTYRRPLLPDAAMRAIVTGAGRTFDPVLAKVFLHVMGAYPVGSVLRLDSGETAVSYRPVEGHPMHPQAKIVLDDAGGRHDPLLVDLNEDRRRVVGCIDPESVGINPAHYL